jgi:putative toxin-antitoxin system antitoxin component (TIGR02293 family)
MKKLIEKNKVFDPKQSLIRAKVERNSSSLWKLLSAEKEYSWSNTMERIELIRAGVPYELIEVIGKRINLPVKEVLSIFGLPQTTYNKKRREKSLLNRRDSEIVLLWAELVDYGNEVFNSEPDKFNRWLKKPNLSLGGNAPESMLDSITGIQEVRNCLNRIEYGNLA